MTREEALKHPDPSFTQLREAGITLQEWLAARKVSDENRSNQ